MTLRIETFSNQKGGDCFFKALGHPGVQDSARVLLSELRAGGPVAVYDPFGFAEGFAALHPLDGVALAGIFVQDIRRIGQTVLGRAAQPVTDLAASRAKTVMVLAFDSERTVAHMRHLVPRGARILSLDAMRLPEDAQTNRRRYLDPLNFATNFAFFRDGEGHHTRVVTANYWSRYGATAVTLWLKLFDGNGKTLAEWREPLPPKGATVMIDSKAVRARFGLGPFTGQLFIHAVGAAGHDIVKYALDTYGDSDTLLSCTHDANAWPADLYAGLPAPEAGERVILWVQNSHPCPIPAKGVGLNLMGSSDIRWLDRAVEPFGSFALDVSSLLPDAKWPQQIEIQAGRHFVRPRYEVLHESGRTRIAHPNVERTDLKPDAHIPELGNLMGKGYLLPAPILPLAQFSTAILATPMSTAQAELPVAVIAYDPDGKEVARHSLGRLPRNHRTAVEIDRLVPRGDGLGDGFGHAELVYDFADGGTADGWLHALVRYRARESGHAAETSFGAHIFNTVLTYANEPQSYSGPAPGLSTRLFLRLGDEPADTMCHLIYPASTPWHVRSETELILMRQDGEEVARHRIEIPCGGSRLWRYSEAFTPAERRAAGAGAHVVIRDVTCRLFGYHGVVNKAGAFSLDHMFGF